jgi:ketosteroid isomerase-like protein
VSSSDLDRVREMYDAWNNGNVDRMIEFWWDDATWEDDPETPDRHIIRGRENVEARLREVMGVMGDLKMEVVELVRRYRLFNTREHALEAAESD